MRHNRSGQAALKDSTNYRTSDGDMYLDRLDELFNSMEKESNDSKLRPTTLPPPIEISADDPEY